MDKLTTKHTDLTGDVYGQLKVLSFAGYYYGCGQRYPRWNCKCSCGVDCIVRGSDLRSGQKSCGCQKNKATGDRSRTHGSSGTREYHSWCAMRARCSNPKIKQYCDYGGRGIRVCERWDSFENFLSDMGPSPSPKHSIDRIDADGDYEPTNCRWATYKEQMSNKRNNKTITYRGETLTLADWSRRLGVAHSGLYYRFNSGWSHDEIIETPFKIGNRWRER